MAKIEIISNPTESFLKEKKIFSWPIWEKEISEFPWTYDSEETCYFLDGEVTVVSNNETINIKKGDLVTFPVGLSCTWKIKKPVRKHYQFKD